MNDHSATLARVGDGRKRRGGSLSVTPLVALLILAMGMLASPRLAPSGSPTPSPDAMLSEGSMAGETVLITGSTDGLGREVALELASAGAHVIVHGRNAERGAAVVAEIQREGKGSARFYAADLASFEQVRQLAQRVLADYPRLDVLVNNAGIWLEGPRQTSADGHELHFQVNYLSGYLLTKLLLSRLEESAPSRIVNVASGAQQPIDFSDVMLERGYSDGRAYAQSKLAQVMFTFDLARELEGKGVAVNTLHPATYMDTNMVTSRGIRPANSVEDGAAAVVNLITGTDVGSGQYFNGLRPARANAQAYDDAARQRLKALSDRLTAAR
jgi:NAD(P)-dependent dehydrogenase (short-subunit alcohol dehydrogenase family)